MNQKTRKDVDFRKQTNKLTKQKTLNALSQRKQELPCSALYEIFLIYFFKDLAYNVLAVFRPVTPDRLGNSANLLSYFLPTGKHAGYNYAQVGQRQRDMAISDEEEKWMSSFIRVRSYQATRSIVVVMWTYAGGLCEEQVSEICFFFWNLLGYLMNLTWKMLSLFFVSQRWLLLEVNKNKVVAPLPHSDQFQNS